MLAQRFLMVLGVELCLRHRYFAITGAKAEMRSYFLQFEPGLFGCDLIASELFVALQEGYSRRLSYQAISLSSAPPQSRLLIRLVLDPNQLLICRFHSLQASILTLVSRYYLLLNATLPRRLRSLMKDLFVDELGLPSLLLTYSLN